MWKCRARLNVEGLESKEVPAAVGLPWGNSQQISVSFAPDGNDAGGQANALSAKFAGNPDYIREILRAFQTWAAVANINFAVRSDSGAAFGTAGAAQGDPRFGDVRIGAVPMSVEALSVSTPYDPSLSGTWSGDVFFNTNSNFGTGGADLFSVALHEVGHVLGLGHSTSPTSVMFSHLGRTQLRLSANDIRSAVALYGPRNLDRFDLAGGNGPIAFATKLSANSGQGSFDGTTPLTAFASISGRFDRDTYVVRPDRDYSGPVTFRVQSAGISLLAPKVTVLDRVGRVIQTTQSTDPMGSTLTLRLDSVVPGQRYFVRVEGATQDVFAVGAYALAVTFDDENEVSEARIDEVLRGPYATLSPSELRLLFEDPDHLINDDGGRDDEPGHATRLTTTRGFGFRTHYDAIASLAGPTDVDTYQLRTPQWARNRTGVLSASVWSIDGQTPPTIQILDKKGQVIPSRILANGSGRFTVELVGAVANKDYLLELTGADAGNYSLAVDLTTRPAAVSTFEAGELTQAEPNAAKALYVAQSQLFNVIFSAGAGGSARMSVIDATGATAYTLTAEAGQTVSGPGVFLKGGAYAVVFESLNGPTTYELRGAGLTIPIGPITTDATGRPVFTLPDSPPGTYVYPGTLIGYDPFLANFLATHFGIDVGLTGGGGIVTTTVYLMTALK